MNKEIKQELLRVARTLKFEDFIKFLPISYMLDDAEEPNMWFLSC